MAGSLNAFLTQHTAVFGLEVWVLIGIFVSALIVLILCIICIWASRRTAGSTHDKFRISQIPNVSKEIMVDRVGGQTLAQSFHDREGPFLSSHEKYSEHESRKMLSHLARSKSSDADNTSQCSSVCHNDRAGSSHSGDENSSGHGRKPYSPYGPVSPSPLVGLPEFSHLGWGHWFTLRDLEYATNRFSKENVLGEGGYGIVYRGRLVNGTEIAVKKLLNNLGQAEKEFRVEVEAIGHVRHKNLVRLLGYCIEGIHRSRSRSISSQRSYMLPHWGTSQMTRRLETALLDKQVLVTIMLLKSASHSILKEKTPEELIVALLKRHEDCRQTIRMLVYEYVNNGNLEQWLHGAMRQHGVLSWESRMKVILGTAKALAYLHEAIEPKVVHRDIKSSNILLDHEFNSKVSDFGLAKLLGSGKSHIATRVMGTFGYVAPEYANTGLLNEKSDVFSFGVLLLESVTGRDPVDYGRPTDEVNLVEWLKLMVGSRRAEEVVDPDLVVKPTSRVLKRTLLVALRCVDPDSEKRPNMGQVVRMLEAEEGPHREDRRSRRSNMGSMEIESLKESSSGDLNIEVGHGNR